MRQLDPTLLAGISSIAESIINQSLALDPASQTMLSQLDNQACELIISPMDFTTYIFFENGKLRISSIPCDTQLRIQGAPIALSALINAPNTQSSLAQTLQKIAEEQSTGHVELNSVELEGDLHMAVAIRDFLAHLDLDWEAALAEKIGDVPAHFIGKRLRKFIHWEKNARSSLLMNVDEYVHEESHNLPTRYEHEQYKQAVGMLNQRTSDLEARINRISQFAKTDTTK
jgi:ubiquinone biosynthesis protein UbiJ